MNPETDTSGLPYSRDCFVCGCENRSGLQLRFIQDGHGVKAETVLMDKHQGYPGIAHGGVVTAMLDECMGWASTLRTKRFSVTAELKVRFLHPVPLHQKIVVRGWNVRCTARLHHAAGEIVSEAGAVLIKAEGKFIPLSPEETRRIDAQLIYGQGRPSIP